MFVFWKIVNVDAIFNMMKSILKKMELDIIYLEGFSMLLKENGNYFQFYFMIYGKFLLDWSFKWIKKYIIIFIFF